MFMLASQSIWARSLMPPRFAQAVRHMADGPRRSPLTAEKTQELRDWAADFETKELTKDLAGCEVRYDRSGGPGGQNVNKVNTKATLRISIAKASPTWIPATLTSAMTGSPYYTQATHSLLVSGSSFRTQSANLADCFTRIQTHLLTIAKPLMPNETSPEKQEAIEKMMVRAKERAKKENMLRKNNKDARRGRGGRDE